MPIQKGPANLGAGSVDSTELSNTLDLSAKTVTYRTIVAGDIASNAITTAKIADANITPAKMANSGAELGMRNFIINGNLDVWQRGTSFTVNNASGTYTADRWACYANGSVNVTVSQQAGAFTSNGTSNSIRVQRASGASGRFYLYQMFETTALNKMRGKTVTFSFWGRCGSEFTTTDLVTRVATKSAESSWDDAAVERTDYTTPLTTSWQKFTVSLAITSASVSANGLTVAFIAEKAATTANCWYEIAQAQLEIGSTVTPFEFRSYGTELQLCQRYYQIATLFRTGTYYASGAGAIRSGAFQYLVYTRAVPTITFSSQNYGNCSGVTTDGVQQTHTNTYVTASGAGGFNWEATIAVSAEL